jgi:hypothetical protein
LTARVTDALLPHTRHQQVAVHEVRLYPLGGKAPVDLSRLRRRAGKIRSHDASGGTLTPVMRRPQTEFSGNDHEVEMHELRQ